MARMQSLMQKLPAGIGYEWTGVSLQTATVGLAGALLYALSILVVFPEPRRAVRELDGADLSDHGRAARNLGRARCATALHLENDVYFQVGLLTTIGLSSKNAILIVEFARDLEAQGKSAIDAALEAAHLRLRPILMTSLAFVLGVLPLAIANGAGSGSENAVGRGVIGGMLTSTFLAPFLIPMFFFVITEKLFKSKAATGPVASIASPEPKVGSLPSATALPAPATK
jgi:multidrug efflux pump